MPMKEKSSRGQANPAQLQLSDFNIGETDDLVELQVTLSRSSKASNPQLEDIKSYFGESNEAPLDIGKDLPYYVQNVLPKSDFIQLGVEIDMATLVKVGLLHFATSTSNISPVDSNLVQTFLEKYNPPERKVEFFKLAFILVDVESVAKSFWLSTGGASVLNLTNSEFNVEDGFLLRAILEELDANQRVMEVQKAPKATILPTW